jgi:leader peptidase (prepilin peptidase)/N-methyltransferase
MDLVPVLSWLWLRGRCRCCKSPIGVKLLVIEVLTTLAGALLAYSVLK